MSLLRPDHFRRAGNAPLAMQASRGQAAFLLGLALVIALVKATVPLDEQLAPLLVIVAALGPFLLWTAQPRKYGMPILPFWCGTYVVTYGYSLIDPTGAAASYTPDQRWLAAWTIIAFCLLATATWWFVMQWRFREQPAASLQGPRLDALFLGVLVAYPLYFNFLPGIVLNALGPAQPVVRSLLLSTHTLAVFYLGCRAGRRAIRGSWLAIALVFLTLTSLLSITSLLLVSGIFMWFFWGVGFYVGRGKVPWMPVLIVFTAFTVLNLGKAQMRSQCSESADCAAAGYQRFLGDWLQHSQDRLLGRDAIESTRNPLLSLFDRMQLSHILMLVQSRSPDPVPYLAGGSYQVIPALMVPRFLSPDRADTHEGTKRLNIQYGLQTREMTQSTTVGWGLLNEAYANYGLAGLIGLAVLLAVGFGVAAGLARGQDLLSFRSLFCFLLLANAANTEATMGIFVTAVLQATVALILLRIIALGDAAKPLRARAPVRG